MAVAAPGKITSGKIGPWKGMNEKVSPDLLPPGVAADLQNLLLDETPGIASKRRGSRAQGALPSALPPRDTYVFTKLDGTEYQLVSDGVTLYYTTDPSNAALYTSLITGLNTDGFMSFETAENKVWMSNGINSVMAWDGTTLLKYDRAFASITNLTTVDSTHILHAGLTASDDYWNGMKLVFTVGANVGTVVTVTDYVESTKTLTFTPAVAGIAATDRFKVGVVIPKGAALRYWDGHLFDGCTTDNQAELRFNEISDPNTGAVMTLDNPQAWPAENELALTVIDQEKLWGISPVLRDRIMVHKANGLWRLERDPLVVYRLELVSRAIGSRFPDTWREKNNLLYFLGQDKDGLPEIYKTDMVDVNPVDPDGGIEPTLRGLQQPNAVFRNQTFTSQSDFDAGTKSTKALTENGSLGIDGSLPVFTSSSNIDTAKPDGSSGYHGLLGAPDWDVRYDAASALTPANSTPVWVDSGAGLWSIVAGRLVNGNGSAISSSRTGLLSASANAAVSVKMKLTGTAAFYIWIANGSKSAYFGIWRDAFGNERTIKTGDPYVISGSLSLLSEHIYTLQLLADGTFKVWIDGVLFTSGTAPSTTTNIIQFGHGTIDGQGADLSFVGAPGGVGASTSIALLSYATTSSSGVPDTMLLSGNFVVQYDFTRAPDALRRLFQVSTLYGSTIGLETWTSSSSDFSTGNDGAGYLAVANGAQPTSAIKQYMRVRVTITIPDVLSTPTISNLYAGMLWLSPAVNLGTKITSWRTFLTTITTPAGSGQSIQIRRATVTTTPVEGDYGAWFAIVNGDNIGTILSDVGPPPTSRWVQLKIEQGPNSTGGLPSVDAAVVQWGEGAAKNLPVRGIVHKKRYWITAANSGSAANDIIIVCDRNDQWTKFAGLALNAMIHYKGGLYGLDAAAATQRLLDIEDLLNDDGTAISAYLIDREEAFGAGQLRKNMRWSYLHWNRAAAAWTMTTSYRRDGDGDFTGSGTFAFGTAGQDVRQNFPVGTVGKRIQRKFANAVLDEDMSLAGETFYYDIRPVQP